MGFGHGSAGFSVSNKKKMMMKVTHHKTCNNSRWWKKFRLFQFSFPSVSDLNRPCYPKKLSSCWATSQNCRQLSYRRTGIFFSLQGEKDLLSIRPENHIQFWPHLLSVYIKIIFKEKVSHEKRIAKKKKTKNWNFLVAFSHSCGGVTWHGNRITLFSSS